MSDKKHKKSSITDAPSTFLSHLIELRNKLLHSVIAIAIAFAVLFPFSKSIYNWLAQPLVSQGQEMIITGTVAPFLIPMKLTLLVAFLITLPYLFYQAWSFVAPGLYKHEKRLVLPLIASSIALFYLGIAFVYYLLLPMMFRIIPQFAPDVATYSPDIGQYLDFTIMMFIAFGFGFEMPIATILLIATGVTTREKLKSYRPYIIVGAFVIGMLLTPPDVISQVMLAIPMWILFELGLWASSFFKFKLTSDNESNNHGKTASVVAGTSAVSANALWEDDERVYEDYADDNSDDDSSKTDKVDEDYGDFAENEDFTDNINEDLNEFYDLDDEDFDDDDLNHDKIDNENNDDIK